MPGLSLMLLHALTSTSCHSPASEHAPGTCHKSIAQRPLIRPTRRLVELAPPGARNVQVPSGARGG
eukprot:4616232-Alexandrium_andersonii.AAC.1